MICKLLRGTAHLCSNREPGDLVSNVLTIFL